MIRFRFEPLDDLGDKLDRAVARARLATAAAEAVNAVTGRADASLQRGEIRDVNLSPAYVKSKTDVQLAEPGGKPRATITTKKASSTSAQANSMQAIWMKFSKNDQ